MDFDGFPYYALNISLLSAVGLWPYTASVVKQIQNATCSVLLTCGLVFQFSIFATVDYTTELLLKNLSPIMVMIIFFLKYSTFWLKSGIIRELMERVKYDWEAIENDAELEIIKKHSSIGMFHTKLFALMLCPVAAAAILGQFTSNILDIILPLNETRPHQLPIMMECFVDQQKYFYYIAFFLDILILIAATTYVATESLCIVLLQHSCGLYEIVSHNIKAAFANVSWRVLSFESDLRIRKSLKRAVIMHNRAADFSHFMKSKLEVPYLIQLTLGIASISVNLFRLSQVSLSLTEIEELVTSMSLVVAQFGYIFYLNYMMQGVLDWSGNVFSMSYDTEWYKAPLTDQRVLLIILMRSLRIFNFDLCGFFSPSIEGFSLIARASVSYFMVLHSTQ